MWLKARSDRRIKSNLACDGDRNESSSAGEEPQVNPFTAGKRKDQSASTTEGAKAERPAVTRG